jgi:tripartite-type tricarboxylate transporter receptor subunit TctC
MFPLAPAKIPAEIASQMLHEVAAALKDSDVQNAFEKQGANVTEIMMVEALKAIIRSESERWGAVANYAQNSRCHRAKRRQRQLMRR